jgi:hypothetical protein
MSFEVRDTSMKWKLQIARDETGREKVEYQKVLESI